MGSVLVIQVASPFCQDSVNDIHDTSWYYFETEHKKSKAQSLLDFRVWMRFIYSFMMFYAVLVGSLRICKAAWSEIPTQPVLLPPLSPNRSDFGTATSTLWGFVWERCGNRLVKTQKISDEWTVWREDREDRENLKNCMTSIAWILIWHRISQGWSTWNWSVFKMPLKCLDAAMGFMFLTTCPAQCHTAAEHCHHVLNDIWCWMIWICAQHTEIVNTSMVCHGWCFTTFKDR